jgi:type I restriction enzyme M protein
MSAPLTVTRNNYIEKPKRADIQTPQWLADRLAQIVKPYFEGMRLRLEVLDPACGHGNLLRPFIANDDEDCWNLTGVDIAAVLHGDVKLKTVFICGKFEDIDTWTYREPHLIMCNPPFNGHESKALYPEVFLRHIDKLFGCKIPLVLVCPMGMRLNQRMKTTGKGTAQKRWEYLRDNWDITSIMTLPLDVFDNDVLFHAEVLFFNMPGLKPHYFINEKPNA